MYEAQGVSALRVALLIPSFYGATTWAFWLGLYELRLVAWEPTSPVATAVLLAVLFVFAGSFVIAFRPYQAWYAHRGARTGSTLADIASLVTWRYVAALHALGFIGLGLYIREMAAVFGGLPSLVEVFALSSYAIRWQSEVTSSVGTQLSYFGWIAV